MVSPHELKNKEFQKAMRGYSIAEVDEYIEFILAQYTELYRQNAEMEQQLAAANEQIGVLQGKETSINSALLNAQKAAEKIINEANEQANTIMISTQNNYHHLMNQFAEDIEKERSKFNELRTSVRDFKAALYEAYQEHIRYIEEVAPGDNEDDTTDYTHKLRDMVKEDIASGFQAPNENADEGNTPAVSAEPEPAPAPDFEQAGQSAPEPAPAPVFEQAEQPAPEPAPAPVFEQAEQPASEPAPASDPGALFGSDDLDINEAISKALNEAMTADDNEAPAAAQPAAAAPEAQINDAFAAAFTEEQKPDEAATIQFTRIGADGSAQAQPQQQYAQAQQPFAQVQQQYAQSQQQYAQPQQQYAQAQQQYAQAQQQYAQSRPQYVQPQQQYAQAQQQYAQAQQQYAQAQQQYAQPQQQYAQVQQQYAQAQQQFAQTQAQAQQQYAQAQQQYAQTFGGMNDSAAPQAQNSGRTRGRASVKDAIRQLNQSFVTEDEDQDDNAAPARQGTVQNKRPRR